MKSIFDLFRTETKETTITEVKKSTDEKCKYCNGDGWVYAGEGTMEDCHPCKRTGKNK